MNDPLLAIDKIEAIISKARCWSEPEQLAAYAVIMHLLRKIDEHIDDHELDGGGNASMKVTGVEWHVGAMFGLDITNGHDVEAHHSWALGDLNALRGIFNQA